MVRGTGRIRGREQQPEKEAPLGTENSRDTQIYVYKETTGLRERDGESACTGSFMMLLFGTLGRVHINRMSECTREEGSTEEEEEVT